MPTSWINTKTLQVDGDTGLTASQPAANTVKVGIDLSAGDKQILFWGLAATQFQGSANLTFDSGTNTLTLAAGQLLLPNGTAAVPSLSFSSATNTGLCWGGSNLLMAVSGGSFCAAFNGLQIQLDSGGTVGWSSATAGGAASDVKLTRAGAGQLSLSTGSQFLLPDGGVTAPSLAFGSETNLGIYRPTAGSIAFGYGNNINFRFWSDGTLDLIKDTAKIRIGASVDVALWRDAAGVLAQRNGTNAQTFRIYNTFTDAGNNEYGMAWWTGNEFQIRTIANGSGTNRYLVLGAAAGQIRCFSHVVPYNDATYDLGVAGALRWRTGYFGGANASQGIIIKAGAAQSANLQEWQNSDGTPLAYVTKDGNVYVTDATTISRLTKNSVGTASAHDFDFVVGASSKWRLTTGGGLLPLADDTYYLGTSTARIKGGIFSTYVYIGTNAAGAGALRLSNNTGIFWRNAANDGDAGSVIVNSSNQLSVNLPTVFTGDGSGLPYGSFYGNDIAWAQASAVQNTWYPVSDTDMTDGQLNLVTHDGSGQLTVSKAGKYLVNYQICLESSVVNEHIETGISVSGTVANDGRNHFHVLIANAEIPIGCTAILSLAASATVQIAVRTPDAGTPNLTVQHANLSIVQVGG